MEQKWEFLLIKLCLVAISTNELPSRANEQALRQTELASGNDERMPGMNELNLMGNATPEKHPCGKHLPVSSKEFPMFTMAKTAWKIVEEVLK